MTTGLADSWVALHTVGAPPQLLARALAHLEPIGAGTRAARLAAAGDAALAAAMAAGSDRRAALDLLAADALITLAVLACAEASPSSLEADAAALRIAAAYST
ncbi:MAG: hypothetical protein V4503_11380 [Gemmatimonadota bacterium]